MSLKHIIKHTETEIVFKCYITATGGGTVDISLQNDCTKSTQVYVAPTSIPDETGGAFVDYTGSRVYITGIWWGCKPGKQLDITRILDTTPNPDTVHGHYYLTAAGFYDYGNSGGFADRTYANKDIRMTFDGEGHCIIRLRKEGWNPKVETAVFGPYDNESVVGS
jgi:hypothetical protein